jgi:hypothetical protein
MGFFSVVLLMIALSFCVAGVFAWCLCRAASLADQQLATMQPTHGCESRYLPRSFSQPTAKSFRQRQSSHNGSQRGRAPQVTA